jgi:hypothetical protein
MDRVRAKRASYADTRISFASVVAMVLFYRGASNEYKQGINLGLHTNLQQLFEHTHGAPEQPLQQSWDPSFHRREAFLYSSTKAISPMLFSLEATKLFDRRLEIYPSSRSIPYTSCV